VVRHQAEKGTEVALDENTTATPHEAPAMAAPDPELVPA
jgi:hypothetical protein